MTPTSKQFDSDWFVTQNEVFLSFAFALKEVKC